MIITINSTFNYRILLFFLGVFCVCNLFGQTEKKLIRDGNKQYQNKKYNESEINYRKSLEKNKNSFEGEFNLGDALYKQGKYEEATDKFTDLANKEKDKEHLSKVYHNLGNSLLQQKKYPESVEAFKNSLKNNGKDVDTKYNLAYAQSMIRQQQQQQQQQQNDKDNKENKDQKNQESKSQENKENKDDKNKQQQGQEQQEKESKEKKEQQAGKPKEQKISKEDAERILQALKNDEKETQKKLSRKEARRMSIEKDW